MHLDNKILLDISKELSKSLSKKITRQTIKWMQNLDSKLDQYYLVNLWDDVCYQLQREQSYYWRHYDDMIMVYVISRIKELNKHEANAIWLQTEDSYDYLIEMNDNKISVDSEFESLKSSICVNDIARYIVNKYVYTQAENWRNDKLRKELGYYPGE